MKKITTIVLLMLSLSVSAQKSSLTIKAGYTNSSVDDYIDNYDKKINTSGIGSPEFGIGYTYSFSKIFWISAEPGVKKVGYSYNDVLGKKIKSGIYFNCPIIGTLNIGANKIIAGLDVGFNPNFKIAGGNVPNSYSEILAGIRFGYKISPKISIEAYYRYGESLKAFVSNKNLTTNYISLQARIYLGKN